MVGNHPVLAKLIHMKFLINNLEKIANCPDLKADKDDFEVFRYHVLKNTAGWMICGNDTESLKAYLKSYQDNNKRFQRANKRNKGFIKIAILELKRGISLLKLYHCDTDEEDEIVKSYKVSFGEIKYVK